jgi:hypothetical protein
MRARNGLETLRDTRLADSARPCLKNLSLPSPRKPLLLLAMLKSLTVLKLDAGHGFGSLKAVTREPRLLAPLGIPALTTLESSSPPILPPPL